MTASQAAVNGLSEVISASIAHAIWLGRIKTNAKATTLPRDLNLDPLMRPILSLNPMRGLIIVPV
jgi:hypothetical protein